MHFAMQGNGIESCHWPNPTGNTNELRIAEMFVGCFAGNSILGAGMRVKTGDRINTFTLQLAVPAWLFQPECLAVPARMNTWLYQPE